MNDQEREQLARFLQQLAQAQVGPKDLEAARLIEDACRRQPDAHYLLVQRCLLLEQALASAQAEVARLRSDPERVAASGAFLDSNAWGSRPAAAASAPAFGRAPAHAAAPLSSPSASAAPAPSSFFNSGVLGNVATTAAGVVAGSFLFQGIEHLLGNHGNGASGTGFLPGGNAFAPEALTENVVVNNYYDAPSSGVDAADSFAGDGDADWV